MRRKWRTKIIIFRKTPMLLLFSAPTSLTRKNHCNANQWSSEERILLGNIGMVYSHKNSLHAFFQLKKHILHHMLKYREKVMLANKKRKRWEEEKLRSIKRIIFRKPSLLLIFFISHILNKDDGNVN